MYQQRSLILLPNHLHGQYSQSICNEFLRVSIFWIRSAKIFTMYIKDLGSVFIASAPQIGKEHTNMHSLLWITQIHQHVGGVNKKFNHEAVVNPSRPLGDPNSFNFMHFLGKFGKSYVGTPSPLESWCTHLGEILDLLLQRKLFTTPYVRGEYSFWVITFLIHFMLVFLLYIYIGLKINSPHLIHQAWQVTSSACHYVNLSRYRRAYEVQKVRVQNRTRTTIFAMSSGARHLDILALLLL